MGKITFNKYKELSARTANKHELEIVNYAMGLTGEAGELVDIIKKHLFHDHELDQDKVKKEGGDVLWYSTRFVDLVTTGTPSNIFENDFHETIKEMDKNTKNKFLIVSCLNISKAAGQISGIVDDTLNEKISDPDYKKLLKNVTIVITNLMFIITISGLTIEEVAEANIKKLEERYPEGFDVEKSRNRVVD